MQRSRAMNAIPRSKARWPYNFRRDHGMIRITIVGLEWLKVFPPRLEGRCPFQPYKRMRYLNV